MEPQTLPKHNPNRAYTYAAIIIALIQFIIFKYLYPFPNFLPDSYNYLRSALKNMNANIWPVGYPKLISLVGFFTHNDTTLILVQYAIYIASALYFFFTFITIARYSRWVKIGVFIFLFLNPAFIFISNYISSDLFFTSLSLVWMAQLFRLIKNYSPLLIISHAIILLFAFAVRYNALFYPVISIIVILLTKMPSGRKSFSLVAIILTLATFAMYTANENKRLFGTRQFSVFGGWQMASNALIAYEHVTERNPVPDKFSALHTIVNTYFDSLRLAIDEGEKKKKRLTHTIYGMIMHLCKSIRVLLRPQESGECLQSAHYIKTMEHIWPCNTLRHFLVTTFCQIQNNTSFPDQNFSQSIIREIKRYNLKP
ncbi:hypothetical protein [Chitinophaga pinensis]|uniref:Glycosyltransferase RgtA/B/C/D-like domain-containing protein n=1 Tax=Chitinophaga pinensis TaxID=79329 RepID=A0A5C6M0Y3_9BACT|nr:hypothetical protein [Chitinophaga pinensis]TWW02590.1 hypothetical protein FEF09_01930 [Chitinophaga pinensis]